MIQPVVDRYRRWFEYEQDAHAKVLASFETVPAERRESAEFRRAVSIFAHIVAARKVWLFRFGLAAAPSDGLFPENRSLTNLTAEWDTVKMQWLGFLAKADDDALAKVFEYQALDGNRFRNRIEDILTQLFGHSSYHRGQIAMLVKQAGGQPAITDFVYWCREGMKADS